MSQGMKTTKGGGCLGMTVALIASTVVVAVVMVIVLVLPFIFHEGVQSGAAVTGTSKGENDSDSTWESQLQAYRQAAKTKGDDQNQWKHGQLTVWKNGQPHVYLNGADGKMTEQNNRPWDDSTIIYVLLAFTGISAGLLIAGIFLFVPGIFRTPIPKQDLNVDKQKSKEKAVPPEIPKTASQEDSDGNSDKSEFSIFLKDILAAVKETMGEQQSLTLPSSDPRIRPIWSVFQKANVPVFLTRNAQIATSFNLAANTVTFAVIGTEC